MLVNETCCVWLSDLFHGYFCGSIVVRIGVLVPSFRPALQCIKYGLADVIACKLLTDFLVWLEIFEGADGFNFSCITYL